MRRKKLWCNLFKRHNPEVEPKRIIKMKVSLFLKRVSVDREVQLADKTHDGYALILRVTILNMMGSPGPWDLFPISPESF